MALVTVANGQTFEPYIHSSITFAPGALSIGTDQTLSVPLTNVNVHSQALLETGDSLRLIFDLGGGALLARPASVIVNSSVLNSSANPSFAALRSRPMAGASDLSDRTFSYTRSAGPTG